MCMCGKSTENRTGACIHENQRCGNAIIDAQRRDAVVEFSTSVRIYLFRKEDKTIVFKNYFFLLIQKHSF